MEYEDYFGRDIGHYERLQYSNVRQDKYGCYFFDVKSGSSLKKAAQEVEQYLQEHKQVVDIYFTYNDKRIAINKFWNASQIGKAWLLNNEVDNKIENMTTISTDLYLANKDNLPKSEKLHEDEHYTDIANLFLNSQVENAEPTRNKETEEKKNNVISFLPNKLREIKDQRLAKKKLKNNVIIKNKKSKNLNLEVVDGADIKDIGLGLEKLFTSNKFETATFKFNDVKIVAKKGMTADDIYAIYRINCEIQEEILNDFREKREEIINDLKEAKSSEVGNTNV